MDKYGLEDIMPFGQFQGYTFKEMLEEEISLINYQIFRGFPLSALYRPTIERYFIILEDFYILYDVENFLYQNLPGFRFNSKFKAIKREKEEIYWDEVRCDINDRVHDEMVRQSAWALNNCDACGASPCMCSDPY